MTRTIESNLKFLFPKIQTVYVVSNTWSLPYCKAKVSINSGSPSVTCFVRIIIIIIFIIFYNRIL